MTNYKKNQLIEGKNKTITFWGHCSKHTLSVISRFNPNDIDSVVSAIEHAVKLSITGKGKDNKEYALSNWNTLKISQQLKDVYSFMMK